MDKGQSSAGSPATRRTLLVGGAAGAAGALIAATGASSAQPAATAPAVPVREKGPRVWLDMDQKELDDAYDQGVYAANRAQVVKRYGSESDAARKRLGEPKRLSYGATAVEGADHYAAKTPNAPIHVFVHGGAWRGIVAKESAFHAETFVRAGAHFITLDFNNVLQTGGDLMPMAEQVRRAIAWTYKNAASFGGDPNRLYVSGHSSGAHLAGVALTTDWEKDFGVPKDFIKGALLCSGMYDLKPVRLSARASYVKFTDAIEHALSPQRHLERIVTPVVVAYGSLETPEFQRQSRDFAAALRAAGKPAQLIVADQYNHFEIVETMANPYGLLGRAALEQMNLGPA